MRHWARTRCSSTAGPAAAPRGRGPETPQTGPRIHADVLTQYAGAAAYAGGPGHTLSKLVESYRRMVLAWVATAKMRPWGSNATQGVAPIWTMPCACGPGQPGTAVAPAAQHGAHTCLAVGRARVPQAHGLVVRARDDLIVHRVDVERANPAMAMTTDTEGEVQGGWEVHTEEAQARTHRPVWPRK